MTHTFNQQKVKWGIQYNHINMCCNDIKICRGFSKCSAIPFSKLLYVIARRLPNRFTGGYSGYFRYLFVVYWFVNAFAHQNVKDLFTKIKKYAFTDSFGNHLTITYSFGKLAIWQTAFRKKPGFINYVIRILEQKKCQLLFLV